MAMKKFVLLAAFLVFGKLLMAQYDPKALEILEAINTSRLPTLKPVSPP
jgi:hypothetical protein